MRDWRKQTYSPFDTHHPGSPQHFPVSPDRTHCLPGVTESNSKCVDNLCIGIRLGARSERSEIFYGEGIFVWWIAKDDDVG